MGVYIQPGHQEESCLTQQVDRLRASLEQHNLAAIVIKRVRQGWNPSSPFDPSSLLNPKAQKLFAFTWCLMESPASFVTQGLRLAP